jgi:3-oxoacyl-[acyl-carrier protein] reductase
MPPTSLTDRDIAEPSPPRSGRSLAIISGAAAGIGLATLRGFLARGWACVAIDLDAAGLGRIEDGNREQVKTVVADLTRDDTAVAEHLATLTDAYDDVTLVNNVGGSRGGNVGLAALPWSDAVETLTFNLKPMMRLTQLAFPLMRASKAGRIVNVASVTGRTGALDVAADYAASKGAVIAWSRQLVKELASARILINTVCPGIIATERIQRRWRDRAADQNQAALARIPLGRLGTAEEVAEVICFLGSTNNTYMTGAIVDVNGGLFVP